MNIAHHQNQTQIKDGNVKMTKTMTNGSRRCGYSPYGYVVRIGNRHLEFATESEFDEWIGDNDYGYDAVI